jgi:general secretion pathway protein B
MSYILDALKRADTERGQSATPPLAGTAPFVEVTPALQVPGTRLWLIAAAALALIAASLWAWQAFQPLANEAVASAPLAASTAPVQSSEPPAAEPMANTATTSPPGPAPAQQPAPSKPAAPVLPILAKAPPPPPKPRPAPAAATTTAKAEKPTTAEAAPPPLSAAQKAALPQIAVSGSSYSANPAHRMLIANGQVIKEGQELSPGLTLESIGARSAIFNQRGTRFNVNY